jgi:hypothetical protein
MRVVAISCVKNELDIIEAFVRHTLAGVDRLIVLDNGSTDGTRQILGQLQAEGLSLSVVDDTSPGHYQSLRMTALMRDHALEKHHADWILPLDADEFLVGSDLQSVLAAGAAPARALGLIWKSYVPDSSDDPNEINPVRRIRYRLRCEARQTVKVVVPATLAIVPGVILDQGNHQVRATTGIVSPVLTETEFLAHFPGRSADQLAMKVAVKHVQYLGMADRDPEWGCHYRSMVARLRADPIGFAEAFRDMTLRYNLTDNDSFDPEVIADPIPYAGGDLRYTPAHIEPRAFSSILECAEEFARLHAALTRRQRELESAVAGLTDEIRSSDAAVRALRQSWTWRAGRVAIGPARWAKHLLRRSLGSRP